MGIMVYSFLRVTQDFCDQPCHRTREDAATQSRLVVFLRSLLEPLAAERLRVSWRRKGSTWRFMGSYKLGLGFRILGSGFRVLGFMGSYKWGYK